MTERSPIPACLSHLTQRDAAVVKARALAPAPNEAPIDMILHCPKCGMLHEDMPSGDWTNPPHKSHLCRVEDGGCGTIWRPADVATNGVRKIKSKSQHDTWEVADHVALAPDDAAIRAELVAALEEARFRLFGAGPAAQPLGYKIDAALAKATS